LQVATDLRYLWRFVDALKSSLDKKTPVRLRSRSGCEKKFSGERNSKK